MPLRLLWNVRPLRVKKYTEYLPSKERLELLTELFIKKSCNIKLQRHSCDANALHKAPWNGLKNYIFFPLLTHFQMKQVFIGKDILILNDMLLDKKIVDGTKQETMTYFWSISKEEKGFKYFLEYTSI